MTEAVPNFAAFADGLGGRICDRLGVGVDISTCQTWDDYTQMMVDRNNKGPGIVVDAATQLHGVASSGERLVIYAALAAANFSAQADSLARGQTWTRLYGTADEVRLAVSAAVLRQD